MLIIESFCLRLMYSNRKFVSNFTFLRSAAHLICVNLHSAVFHYSQVVSSLLVCHPSLSSPLWAFRLDGWDGCPILRLATLLLFACCVRRFLKASSDGLLAPEWKWDTSERCFVPSLFLSLFVWITQHTTSPASLARLVELGEIKLYLWHFNGNIMLLNTLYISVVLINFKCGPWICTQ